MATFEEIDKEFQNYMAEKTPQPAGLFSSGAAAAPSLGNAPDYDAMDQMNVTRDKLPGLMEDIRTELNKLVAPYERIAKIQLMATEFDKTPKRSIKRYLYSN